MRVCMFKVFWFSHACNVHLFIYSDKVQRLVLLWIENDAVQCANFSVWGHLTNTLNWAICRKKIWLGQQEWILSWALSVVFSFWKMQMRTSSCSHFCFSRIYTPLFLGVLHLIKWSKNLSYVWITVFTGRVYCKNVS